METINYFILGLIAICLAIVLFGFIGLARNNSNTVKDSTVRAKPSTIHTDPRGASRTASVNRTSKRHSLREYDRHSRYEESDNPIVTAAVVSALDSDDYRPRHVDCAPSWSEPSSSESSSSSSSSFGSSSCSGFSSSSSSDSSSSSSFSDGGF